MNHRISLNKNHLEIKNSFLSIDLINRRTITTNHRDRINSIAVWKNKFIFTASNDDKIHIYSILTSQKVGEFPSFGDPVVSMEIFKLGSHSMLCFSDLCQRIYLMKITSKKLLRMQDHLADIMLILYLRDNRHILFSDTEGKLFSWDFRTNHLQDCMSSLCMLGNFDNSFISFLKFLDESIFPDKNLIYIGFNFNQRGFLILATLDYSPTKKLQNLNIFKKFSFEQRISSMNFSSSLKSFILGSSDSSLIIANLSENNEISTKNHSLICSPKRKITEIAIIECKDSGNCWAIATNDVDETLFIIDLQNLINYEISDSLVSILYCITKSNMEFFERKGRFYLAMVSHTSEFLLFYEISLKFEYKNTPSLNILKKESHEKTLFEIYVFWYGHPAYLAETLGKKNIKNVDFPYTHLQHLWTKIWFAKNEEQRKIDEYLKKFEGLLSFNEDFSKIETQNFFIDFSLLILYDQISRNIFRKSEKAYNFDKKALKIAEKYKENLHCLALQNILTVLICFLHSENINDQIFVKKQIEVLKLRYGMQYNEIISHLSLIHQNHYERIQLFGRIPERNQYLGRKSTQAEIVYIKSVDSSKIY